MKKSCNVDNDSIIYFSKVQKFLNHRNWVAGNSKNLMYYDNVIFYDGETCIQICYCS